VHITLCIHAKHVKKKITSFQALGGHRKGQKKPRDDDHVQPFPLMQKMETMERKFNPFPHFTLHNMLSHVAPLFYTEEDLAQIEKINQHLRQETKLPINIPQSTMKGETVIAKKRCRSSDEGSIADVAERSVKPKTTKKMENLSSPPPILPIDVEISKS